MSSMGLDVYYLFLSVHGRHTDFGVGGLDSIPDSTTFHLEKLLRPESQRPPVALRGGFTVCIFQMSR